MTPIASRDNPQFRAWLKLSGQTRVRRAQRRTFAEGLHLAQAALDSGVPIHGWIVRRGATGQGRELDAVLARLSQARVAGFELAAALYDELSPVEHGAGLMLIVATAGAPPPAAAAHDLLFLDGIQDPGNVGTLLRIAAAAGVGHVLGSPGCADFWSPKALRAGMGAQFALRLTEGVAAAGLPAMLGGPWYACDAHDAASLWDVRLPPTAIGWVIGAEGQGISSEAASVCRGRIRIPLAAGVESLNVAAAAAVCLFERRRRIAHTGDDLDPARRAESIRPQ